MKTIEIVTHCWSGSDVPIYHKLLDIQLASICYSTNIRDRDIQVKVTVVCSFPDQDPRTNAVVDKYQEEFGPKKHRSVYIHKLNMPTTRLFRRAIGRNMAAKLSYSSVIWFTDCDHVFRNNSLEIAVDRCLASDKSMVFPSHIHIHKSHKVGDALLQSYDDVVDYSGANFNDDFIKRGEKRAIGGLQIVKGNWAREHGYLQATNWMNPVNHKKGFKSCKCDVAFRKVVGESEGVEIPGVYRLRHSRAGRDHGKVDHGAKRDR